MYFYITNFFKYIKYILLLYIWTQIKIIKKGGADIDLPYFFLSLDKSEIGIGRGETIFYKDGDVIEPGDHIQVYSGFFDEGFGRSSRDTERVRVISVNNTDKTVTVLYPYYKGKNKTGIFNFKDISNYSRPLFHEGSKIMWDLEYDGKQLKGEGIIKDMNTKWPNYIITQTV